MTSITKLAPIVVRAANEPPPSEGGISQHEYAEGADLQGSPLVFAKSTDTSCHIDPATVRKGLKAIELAATIK